MAELDAESAVRRYMMFLLDPESLRDEAALAEADVAVAAATDPIDRLKAMAARERLKAVDGERYRHDFITHARAWAEAEGIPVKVFLDAGVPAADLAAAGLAPAPGVGRRVPSPGPTRGRAPRLSLDEVAAALPSVEFRLSDLAAVIGREPATTRNYLNKLVAQGVVVDLGDDPRHDGRGKPPKLYARA